MRVTDNNILSRIDDFIIEDILSISDDEIISEVKKECTDLGEIIKRTREVAKEAMSKSGKSRLTNARNQLDSIRSQTSESSVIKLSFVRKRSILESVQSSSKNFTKAARNESLTTENDLNNMLQDLISLGVIDENGNIK